MRFTRHMSMAILTEVVAERGGLERLEEDMSLSNSFFRKSFLDRADTNRCKGSEAYSISRVLLLHGTI